ncbi:galactose-binding like protein [Lindgomyces ingoldianus]|uniref:Galactose-binding like protein n=1 Tax=Lindgomyces ingoldianus TaxID=673940 RepID=A0ACB6QTB0_9PLEO|nr:galactose-binding like protein [Lindgomyces ingoldianus]KAF2469808.1 galactose-binding like protein [Lindgomyces ingoldianus]
MPPTLRRRGQPSPHQHYAVPVSDSDEADDQGVREDEEEVIGDELAGVEAEEEDEDDDEEEPLVSPTHSTAPSTHNDPIPPNLREISNLASWTVSSNKPGCSIPQLRSPSNSLFWQSDGPQPHYLNIHFFKLVRIVGLRLYLDFDADESYTPTRIVFLAGSGGNDLVEWGEMRLEQPRGWVWADFSGVGDVEDEGEDSEDEDGEGGFDGEDDGSEGGVIGRLPDLELALNDDISDSENTQPTNTPVINGPGIAIAGATRGDPMAIDTPTAPGPTPPLQLPPTVPHHSPQHVHQQIPNPNVNPSSIRPHPRAPLHPLPSVNTTPFPRLSRKKKPKLPVLRAHLVQIKILENHQNGKDTHLRGLQIFARDNEGGQGRESESRVVVGGRKSVGGGGIGGRKRTSGSRGGGVIGGAESGGGSGGRLLARSEWDVEGSIR